MRGVMVVEAIEGSTSPRKRAPALRLVIGLFVFVLLATAARFLLIPPGPRPPVDFDQFHLVGRLVWQGGLAAAYRFDELRTFLQAEFGGEPFLPWTYPLPFALVVAALALLPVWLAYTAFTGATLLTYTAVLNRLAAEDFVPILILFGPVFAITVRCGQNGLLTGTLVGLAAHELVAGRCWAGVPLGLMVIKPHLALGLAAYLLITRRWTVIITAAVTAVWVAAVATIVLGPEVWCAFAEGMREARTFLAEGYYPFYRMVSCYAALRTLGVSAPVAFGVQVAVALTALAVVALAAVRLPSRQAIGIAVSASLLMSPYAYDYDLTVVAMGFALLMPDLILHGHHQERTLLYVLFIVAGSFGLAQSTWLALRRGAIPELTVGDMPLSIGGFALLATTGLAFRILWRGHISGSVPGRLAPSDRS